jgi:Na+/proline symporter
MKVKSVFEYFELRFKSKNVRILGMISYVTKTFISTAIFIYGPATSLQLLNINIKLAIIVIGVIGTFYTAIGGIKAVYKIYFLYYKVFTFQN